MASVLELYPSDALLWLEFGGIYADSAGNRYIDNLALRGDAPARVTCGAGAACPTQLSGRRGVSFDGGDYIDCGLVDRFERTDKFTLVVCCSISSSGITRSILSSQDDAQDYRGVSLYHQTANELIVNVNSSSTRYVQKNHGPANAMRSLCTIALSYDGTSTAVGCVAYYNGAPASVASTVSNTLDATIKNGKSFLLGARHNGANKTGQMTGSAYFAAIFPLAASVLQVQNLHKRVMRRINLP